MKRAFIHGNVLDVIERKIVEDCTVVVEDGVITEVSPQADLKDAEIVDLKGKYMIPGLFNCHVHTTSKCVPDPLDNRGTIVDHTLVGLKNLELMVKAGFTFIRDVGCEDNIGIELKNAIKDGRIKMAPDMQAAGNPICMTGGTTWNFVGYQADGEDECRKAARLMLRSGADVIKLMATGGIVTHGVKPGSPQLNERELRAAVEEAHHAGVKACCHAQNIEGAQNAIRAGVDCIEHGSVLDDETIQMMLEHGTWLDGTVSTASNILGGQNMGAPLDFIEKMRAGEKKSYESFRRAFDAGVPCALGSDAGTSFCYHAESAKELVIMVEKCGLTPMDVLVIGTINSAKLCGVEESLGSITVGKKAHLAVFEENPLENIYATMDCCMTVKNGEILWNKDKYIDIG